MLNKKRTTAIAICSMVAISCPVYAESTGNISISANVKDKGFKGEIYIIIGNDVGNQRLAILNQNNNYQYKLNDLQYGSYDIKDVHVYNTDNESAEDRKEINKKDIDFTIENEDLNIREDNQNSTVIVDVNSVKDSEVKESKNDEKKEDVEEESQYIEHEKDEQQKSNNSQENKVENKSTAMRKRVYFFNFIFDAILILGLGSIWFLKVRERKDKK